VEKAVRICDAKFGDLKPREGDNLRTVAARGGYRRNLMRENWKMR